MKLVKCKKCKRLKPHHAKGLCSTCYHKQFLKVCGDCGKLKPHHGKGLCGTCYSHKVGKHKPYLENKNCSQYIGLVAEQVLSKVFKDVTQMPNNNKGYDFICNKGMKIDVKSGIFRLNKNQWQYAIKKNKVADYFLCVAIDNREDMIPQHLWLIPNKEINHLSVLAISKITIHKWSQYELPLEKTLECYKSIKGENHDTK